MQIITLSSKGQITIPKDIREEYGFKEGDRIFFERLNDGMLLKKSVKNLMDYEGFLRGAKTRDEKEASELIFSHIMGED